MLNDFWKQLKSGTDIRGTAISKDGQKIDLTDEVIEKISGAFLYWLSVKTGKSGNMLSVAIGRDSRLSGPRIMNVVEKTFEKAGIKVLNCGISSTPAMFMTTIDLKCDGAVEITASHHPQNRNGLKFFTPDGGLESKDITEILEYAQAGKALPHSAGKIEKVDFMASYANKLRNMICCGVGEMEKPLEGLHIVVDAGNGVGGFYVSEVLEPLGADVSGSQFLEPDGSFPNHIPNPENREAMESVCNAVRRANADLGIIFDTDVDRAGCVDSQGREINKSRFIALASVIALDGNEGATIVTDSITSNGLKDFIEKNLGGVHLRFKRGYKNVINEAIRLNKEGINSPLAIETSGHAALRENYFLDDGAYLITKIVIKAALLKKKGQRLEDLIEGLKEAVESEELRFNIQNEDFRKYGQELLDRLEAFARKKGWSLAEDSYEGVRISFGKNEGEGWLLLRLSVHDPVMPLNIESDVAGGCRIIAAKLNEFLKNEQGLDISPLKAYIGE